MIEDETEMAEPFALRRGFQLTGQLGAGLNGGVWKVRGKDNRAWAPARGDGPAERTKRHPC